MDHILATFSDTKRKKADENTVCCHLPNLRFVAQERKQFRESQSSCLKFSVRIFSADSKVWSKLIFEKIYNVLMFKSSDLVKRAFEKNNVSS